MHPLAVVIWPEGIDTWVHDATGLSPSVQGNLFETAVTVASLWLLRVLVLRIVARRGERVAAEDASFSRSFYQWRQGTAYVSYGLAFLLVGRIWVESFESLATVFGLISAGLAVALKDPLLNFAGWLFIVWRKPFELGDRIELGKYRGDVVGQGMFTFSLMEIGNWVDADDRTGRLLVAPNGAVFTEVIANYSKGWFEHVWNELAVIVTFESNWRAAQELLADIAMRKGADPKHVRESRADRLSQEFLFLQANCEPRVFVSVADIGVTLTLRYMCMPFERRRSAEGVWMEVLDAFGAREDIDFAYPTLRTFNHRTEGKAEMRAQP